MNEFVYLPENLDEALEIRASTGAVPIAGGTDLMVRYRRGSGIPPQFDFPVVLIGKIDALRYIEVSADNIHIGSATTLTEIFMNEDVPQILKLAVGEMASPAIRNVATIGGNIGNASPAGDTLPPLYILDAKIVLKNLNGEREVPIEDFITGPGQTILRSDEIIYEVTIPIGNFDKIYYRKIGTRKALALSKVSFSAAVNYRGDVIDDMRFAFGAVAPVVIRSREIEGEFKNITFNELKNREGEIAQKYSPLINPIDDQRSTAEYRRKVSLRLLKFFIQNVI
ncbi:xanthine dehydrogenase family protein subunit M [bacterium]|nr:xanthine dehydrogenase family protein subunit M [bacterium]